MSATGWPATWLAGPRSFNRCRFEYVRRGAVHVALQLARPLLQLLTCCRGGVPATDEHTPIAWLMVDNSVAPVRPTR